MKKIALLLLSALAVCLSGCRTAKDVPSAPPLEITAKSKYRIVIPAQADNPGVLRFLKQDAELLQRAFRETVGADFPVVGENVAAPAGVKSIYLGDTEAIRKLGVRPLNFQDFNFVIMERDGNIYIAGRDKHRYGSTKNASSMLNYILGTVKGTVWFLEKYLDTRFLLPGANGVDFARLGKVVIPAGKAQWHTPKTVFGYGRVNELFYDHSNNNPGSGAFWSYGGHSWYDAVPAQKYFRSNPEYFALRGGVRAGRGNHLCFSNPAVQELIYQEMLKRLDAGAEVVELAQTDGFSPCLCDKCSAYGDTEDYGEKIWLLHRDLAKRLEKERPGKKVLIICYPPNNEPPRSFSEFPGNVMIELCKYAPKDFDAWKRIKVPGGFIVYVYNWGSYHQLGLAPKRTPKFAGEQIRLFLDNGVKGIYRCGGGENMGLEGPVYYVYGKMLDDPKQDPETLAREYYLRAFQESAVPMRAFYQALYKQLAIYSEIKGTEIQPNNPRALFSMIYTPELLDTLNRNLDGAMKLAKNPVVQKRLALVAAEFAYVKNLAEIAHLYNAYRVAPDRESFSRLGAKVEERNAIIRKLCSAKGGRVARLADWPEVVFLHNEDAAGLRQNGRGPAILGAPYTWNIKLLQDKRILPGVGRKLLKVKKAAAPVTFGDFNSGVWQEANWEELNGIQLGAIGEQSRFKALYDDKKFHLAFESDLDPDKKYNPLGVDGACWTVDCLEVFLDPTGSREVYYQFIYNPIADSRFDSRFGFITDPLHPDFNKQERAWNGQWEYQTKRIGGKWYSLFSVPFSALNTPPPRPGSVWTLNIGRESRKLGSGATDDPELSLWSPNLETMGFHDREAFGEAVFE